MGRTHVTLDLGSGVRLTRPVILQSSHQKLTLAARALSWLQRTGLTKALPGQKRSSFSHSTGRRCLSVSEIGT
jgi:hypothetical protein